MNKFEITICLILLIVFLTGCFRMNTQDPSLFGDDIELSQEKVNRCYFDSFPVLTEFANTLFREGFKYGNEINDINFNTDLVAPVGLTLGRRWGNCQDYVAVYNAYCKHHNIPCENILLRRGYEWHYISIIETHDGKIYWQTNMNLNPVISKSWVLEHYKTLGWNVAK